MGPTDTFFAVSLSFICEGKLPILHKAKYNLSTHSGRKTRGKKKLDMYEVNDVINFCPLIQSF